MEANQQGTYLLVEQLAQTLSEDGLITEQDFKDAVRLIEENVKIQHEELLAENDELRELSFALMLKKCFDDHTRGLTDTQKEKMWNLAVDLNLEEEDPFGDFEKKIESLRRELYAKEYKPGGLDAVLGDDYLRHKDVGYVDPLVRAAEAVSSQLTKYRTQN